VADPPLAELGRLKAEFPARCLAELGRLVPEFTLGLPELGRLGIAELAQATDLAELGRLGGLEVISAELG